MLDDEQVAELGTAEGERLVGQAAAARPADEDVANRRRAVPGHEARDGALLLQAKTREMSVDRCSTRFGEGADDDGQVGVFDDPYGDHHDDSSNPLTATTGRSPSAAMSCSASSRSRSTAGWPRPTRASAPWRARRCWRLPFARRAHQLSR